MKLVYLILICERVLNVQCQSTGRGNEILSQKEKRQQARRERIQAKKALRKQQRQNSIKQKRAERKAAKEKKLREKIAGSDTGSDTGSETGSEKKHKKGEQPQCIEVRCGQMEYVHHGKTECSNEDKFSSVCTNECDSGFQLVGSRVR